MKRLVYGIIVVVVILGTIRAGLAEADSNGSYKVVADSLNIREGPSATAQVIGSLKAGKTVVVTDEDHGWLKVSSDRISGWAAGYYLKKTTSGQSAAPSGGKGEVRIASASDNAVVTADAVRLRTGPGVVYNLVGSVNEGDVVRLLDSKNGWFKVETELHVEGWLSGQFVGGSAGAAHASERVSSARHDGIRGKVIVVDPGHGGNDPGMIGTRLGTEEKDLTLSTSLMLADRLRQLGAKVILTRTRDGQKPSLSDRVDDSESARADAFVSVHFNSAKKNTSGTLAFYYSKKKDAPLARAIEGRLGRNAVGLKDNGISFGDFHVLRENDRPAALIELGFLTNASDEKKIRTASYQRKAANAIAAGLADYFD